MKSNYLKNIAGSAIMAFSLILGISSITAAQSRDPYQNDRYRRQQQQDELRRQQAEQLRRRHRILHQHRDRQRANAAGDWSICSGPGKRSGMNVADYN